LDFNPDANVKSSGVVTCTRTFMRASLPVASVLQEETITFNQPFFAFFTAPV